MSENEETFIRITNKDIWRKLVELEGELEDLSKLVHAVDENTKKIRKLEMKVYTVLSGLVSALVAFGFVVVKGGV